MYMKISIFSVMNIEKEDQPKHKISVGLWDFFFSSYGKKSVNTSYTW